MDTVTVNFLTKHNGTYGTFVISQEDCYDKLKQMMKFSNSKYEEIKLRIYRLRDIILTIDQNDHRQCFVRKVKKSYVDGNLLINVHDDVQTSENSIPKLRKYHSVVSQKHRRIDYNGIVVSFIEERNDGDVINYIELKTFVSKLDGKDFREVVSLVSCTG